MSWYSKGKEQVEQQAKVQEEQRNNRPPNRVWMPSNTSKNVIYLDDEGFTFFEHSVEVGQRWNQFTCLGANNGCPICEAGNKPYQITLFSVIDKSRWTDKRGDVHENEKIIHALKTNSALTLLNKKERWGGLVGKEVIISRGGKQTDPSAGSDFELALKPDGGIKKYKIDPNNPAYQPFNYSEIFAPKSAEFIRQALGYAPKKFQPPADARGSGKLQTAPEGLEEIDSSAIPSDFNSDEDVPFNHPSR